MSAAAQDVTVREAAPAKINLHLHVTGRRADGYHLLDSLVVFAAVADEIRAEPADRLSLAIEGPFAAGLQADAADNLVRRAAEALAARAGIAPRARLTLVKNLPVASGIGGGSADAAATLRALGRLWRLDDAADPALALGLGADVPVCLASRPVVMRGIGDVLLPAPALPRFFLVLGNPGVAVPTAAIFRETRAAGRPLSADAALPSALPDAASLAATLRGLGNDLEPAAIRLAPVIARVVDTLAATPGCLLARMSGSGATCFGIFAEAATAAEGARRLAAEGWWSWHGARFKPRALSDPSGSDVVL